MPSYPFESNFHDEFAKLLSTHYTDRFSKPKKLGNVKKPLRLREARNIELDDESESEDSFDIQEAKAKAQEPSLQAKRIERLSRGRERLRSDASG